MCVCKLQWRARLPEALSNDTIFVLQVSRIRLASYRSQKKKSSPSTQHILVSIACKRISATRLFWPFSRRDIRYYTEITKIVKNDRVLYYTTTGNVPPSVCCGKRYRPRRRARAPTETLWRNRRRSPEIGDLPSTRFSPLAFYQTGTRGGTRCFHPV